MVVDFTKFVPSEGLVASAVQKFLGLARELRKSGSDIVIETDLAEFFGAHKIEPNFASSFRTMVRDSVTQKLGIAVDIVLESGAGPTVHRSLTDSRYFSTVVQISLLTWTHELNSIANGLSQVLARKMEHKPPEERTYYSYDSLLGTMRACKEQTALFQWPLLLQAVEESVRTSFPDLPQGQSRSLPFSLLQGCLDFFLAAQSLPDDRFVRITTHTGYATLVVWAHHVLGLTVVILDSDWTYLNKFGDGQESVGIIFGGSDISICLLDGSTEILFQLVPTADDPILRAEERHMVRGFGAKFLETEPDPSAHVRSIMYSCECERSSWTEEGYRPSLQRLQSTSQLIFGDLFDTSAAYARADYDIVAKAQEQREETERTRDDAQRRSGRPRTDPVVMMEKVLLALTWIANQDVLGELPITISTISEVRDHEVFQSFDFLSALILGHDYSDIATAGAQNVALVSACGWSLYVSTISLPDPVKVNPNECFVAKGVPSLHGERKRFIVDGPPLGFPLDRGEVANRKPYHHSAGTLPSKCLVDVSQPQVLAGIVKSSFEVLVKFECLDPVSRRRQHLRCGYRKLNEVMRLVKKTKPCSHPEPVLENHALNGSCKLIIPPFDYTGYSVDLMNTHSHDRIQPCPTTCSAHPDSPRLPDQVLLSLTMGSSIARWITILASMLERPESNPVFVKSNSCCTQCVITMLMDTFGSEGRRGFRTTYLAKSPQLGIIVL